MVVQLETPPSVGPGGSDRDRAATHAWVREYVARALAGASPQLPIGTVITTTTSTNPATTLGYGTWTAFAAGQVLYGYSGAAPFDVAGASIGGLTHQHDYTDVPAHGHTLTLVNSLHHHQVGISTHALASAGNASLQGSEHAVDEQKNTSDDPTVVSGSADETGDPVVETESASSLPPGVVVYHWERTA